MKNLFNSLNQSINISQQENDIVKTFFERKLLKKKETFIAQGKYCNHVAFINQGTLRVYYNDLEGNEISCFFMSKDNFITSFTSFLTMTPSKETIEAIDEVELFIISRENLEQLCIQVPKIQIWRRMIAENLFILMERRVSMLQSSTAQERYETMIKENAEILMKVPLNYIASFLGITPQHLSRLRNNQG